MLAERVIEWTKSWEQQGIERGIQKGMQKALQEGRKEGESTLLLKQIELKFGTAGEEVRARLAKATSKQLERWAGRLLTANSLSEMFGKR